jgi:colanic acid/amylovoran biosynthesis glycosyltransferase
MKVLHVVSTFPALTQTFVLREIRHLRSKGIDLVIGELRPLHRNREAKGFEDLDPLVSRAAWLCRDMLKGLFFFTFREPRAVMKCLKIILYSAARPQYIAKMVYVLLSSMRLAYRFRYSQIGLVQGDFLHSEALAARFLKLLLQIPYALTVYTVFVHYPRRVIDDILRNASFLVADTCQVKSFLKANGVPKEHIHLIRNGVSLDEFPVRSKNSGSGIPIVLAAGSLIPKKGFHDLLSACALLRQRGISFRCVIIGDGFERDRLMKLKDALKLEDCVEMLGYLSLAELRDWYYRATLFVMPSVISPGGETDGLPTVVIEALASGLPVVGTQTAGIPEVVRDAQNGFLVPANDPGALADHIQILLEREDLREQFRSESRRIAELKFDLKQKGEKLSHLIAQHLDAVHKRSFASLERQAV